MVGSSRVSSMVMTRYFRISSTSTAPRREVFPALLVPATSMVRAPSTMKEIMPAEREVSMRFLMNSGRVHGLSRCRRSANARPVGLRGEEMTATLAFAPGMSSSVSRMGLASSSGLPDIRRSFDAQESASVRVGMMLVLQSV